MHDLRVTFYIRVMCCYLLRELLVIFCIRVTSYYLLPELRVIFYVRVTSYYLLHKLHVKFIKRLTCYYLLHELGLHDFTRVACVKLLCYTSYSSLRLLLINSNVPYPLFLSIVFHDRVLQSYIITSYALMCKTSLHFYDPLRTTSSIPS